MATRQVRWRLFVAWNQSTFIDESSNLISANGKLRLATPESQISSPRGQVDSMSMTLDNSTQRFSPFNTSSPIYASIQNGLAYHAPMYLEVSINGGTSYQRVFTGVIKIPEEAGSNPQNIAEVTVECRSRDELLLQGRASTLLTTFQQTVDQGWSEAQLIDQWLADAGVSGADRIISPGLFIIPWAWLDDESALEEIWALASACGGRFYVDPDGKYRYESATHWLTATRSIVTQESVGRGDFGRCEPIWDDRELFNIVTVEASPRYIANTDVLWEPDEDVYIPAGGSKSMVARLRQPAYHIDPVAFTAVTAGGLNITGNVSVSTVRYAQRVEMTISNSNTTYAAYLMPMRITGTAVAGGPTHEETRTSASHGSNNAFFSARGNRTKSVRGSVYIQSKAHAGMVAEFLLRRHEQPRLSYRLQGCDGVPSRRLGDRVAISDDSCALNNRAALIAAITWRLDEGGFEQDLECIDAAQLYPFQDSFPSYFVINSNRLGSADGLRGRVFF